MEFILNKFVSIIALLLCFTSFNIIAQDDVYRWVDENGVVHYSDQARSEKAKLFQLRQFNKAQPVASAEDVAANNETLAGISGTSKSNQTQDKPSLADTCAELKKQMIIAKAQLQSNDPTAVLRARTYLETADSLLAQSNCN